VELLLKNGIYAYGPGDDINQPIEVLFAIADHYCEAKLFCWLRSSAERGNQFPKFVAILELFLTKNGNFTS